MVAVTTTQTATETQPLEEKLAALDIGQTVGKPELFKWQKPPVTKDENIEWVRGSLAWVVG